jgi:nucleoside-diphosphate-sugar epimerase
LGQFASSPTTTCPLALQQPFDFTQHLELDTARIRRELGYDETHDEAEGLRRTIEWELMTLHQVPDLRLDYAAEDEALQLRVG